PPAGPRGRVSRHHPPSPAAKAPGTATHSPFHDEAPHHPPANALWGYMMAGETPPDSTGPKECSDDHPDSPLAAAGLHRLWVLRARYALRDYLDRARRRTRGTRRNT